MADEGEEMMEDGEEQKMEEGRDKTADSVSPTGREDTMIADEGVEDAGKVLRAMTEAKESGTSRIGPGF